MNMVTDVRQVIRYWWTFFIAGFLLILFGTLVFCHPLANNGDLAIFFEIVFLLNGILEVSFAIINRRSVRGWGWHLAAGIADLLVLALLVFNPILTAVSLRLFVGLWLLWRSIAMIGRQFDLPVEPSGRLWMLFLGLAGLVFSFMVFYNPSLAAFTTAIWMAFGLVTLGLFYISLGFYLKKLAASDSKP